MEQQITRTQILHRIKQKIETIEAAEQQYDLLPLITNIHGIIGIGKTWIMRQIREQFKNSCTIVFMSFDPDEHQKHPEHVQSWREIAANLRQFPTLKHLPDQIPTDNQVLAGEDVHLLYECVPETLSPLPPQEQPLLLLLDALDDVPYWKWIQEQIIKPLLEQHQSLVLITSQSPLFWHFWELREQSELLEPGTFTRAETQAFLQPKGMADMTEELHQLTGGYPLGLEYIVQIIADDKNPTLNKQVAATYRHNMLEKLIEHLPAKVREGHLEELLQQIVSMGSAFDLTSLRRQLNARRSHAQLETIPPARINSTITLLNSRGFILYDRDERKYRLDPMIKELLPDPTGRILSSETG